MLASIRTSLALACLTALAPAQAWTSTVQLEYGDRESDNELGWSVSIAGDTLVASAVRTNFWGGVTLVYERDPVTGVWGDPVPIHSAFALEYCGYSVAIDGDLLASSVKHSGNGKVVLFERAAGTWSVLQQVLSPTGPGFGHRVALRDDLLLVARSAAPSSAYLYERGSGGPFAFARAFDPEPMQVDDSYAAAVAVAGGTAFVGTPGDDFGEVDSRLLGLAGDPASGALFGSDPVHDQLFRVDPATGAATPIGSTGPGKLEGLALDAAGGVLYGVDVDADLLVTIDTASAAVTPVGPTGFGRLRGLAFDPGSGLLYGTDEPTGQLVALDPMSGAGTAVGPVGFAQVYALAFDAAAGVLLGCDAAAGELIAIDPATGAGTAVGPLGLGNAVVHGLAFGASGLLGSTTPDDQLVQIDAALATAAVVGPLFALNTGSVAVHERDAGGAGAWGRTVLLAPPGNEPEARFGGALAVDGDTLVVGASGPAPGDRGAAYVFARDLGGPGAWGLEAKLEVPGSAYFGYRVAVAGDTVVVGAYISDVAYAFRRTAPGTWSAGEALAECRGESASLTALAVDGATIALGSTNAPITSTFRPGRVYLFESSALPPPASYCTAGTSAAGCRAVLSACGLASATAPSGFFLAASGVEGARTGLFFHGVNGRQAAPWGSGTSYQCVVPPVKRGALLAPAGAAGTCDGLFSEDLNARWCPTCPKPAHNPGAGALVQAQLWYRDPFNTSNQTTSLSDALEVTLAP